ncbi:MAG: hypothetical protein GXO29_00180 [Thermotogae bacterium]|nr:hypothetical protein [Thermotogota bacterium]
MVLISLLAQGYETDTQYVYKGSPIVVVGDEVTWAEEMTYTKTSPFKILEKYGIDIIRKGPEFSADIYVSGFKAHDVPVSIDGERFYNACPNRMDAPTVRINPLEVSVMQVRTTSTSYLTGLGGGVIVKRRTPPEEFTPRGFIMGGLLSATAVDAGVSLEGYNQGLYARYTQSTPYKVGTNYKNEMYADIAGKSLTEIYPYIADSFSGAGNLAYRVAEMSFLGKALDGALGYGFLANYYRKVLFPYLMMDEIYSKQFGGHVSFMGHKLYFNTLDHYMDNSLRTTYPMMQMSTDAKVLNAGITNPDFALFSYEIFYRKWSGYNVIEMPAMNMKINNHLLPNIQVLQADLAKNFNFESVPGLGIFVKGGLAYYFINPDDDYDPMVMMKLQTVDPNAKESKPYPIFNLAARYGMEDMAGIFEVAFEPPDPEYVYISLRRPMGKPWWVGNYSLKCGKKIGGRFEYAPNFEAMSDLKLKLDLYSYFVKDQSYLTKTVDTVVMNDMPTVVPITTYKNVDELLAGYRFSLSWRGLVGLTSTYTFAQNLTDKVPFAETPPLMVSLDLNTPKIFGLRAGISFIWNDAQTRVDTLLNEQPTTSWWRTDLAVEYTYDRFTAKLEIDNLTDNLYYRHLSYMRNPFAAGVPTFEPGRTVRLLFSYGM